MTGSGKLKAWQQDLIAFIYFQHYADRNGKLLKSLNLYFVTILIKPIFHNEMLTGMGIY